MNRYLLPCSCGRKIPIEVGQAGQTIHCECGSSLEVPTMLEMATLEKVETESPPATPTAWGIRQSLVLLGIVMLLASIVPAVVAYHSRPRSRSAEQIREVYQARSPVQTLRDWQRFRIQGPDPYTRREKEHRAHLVGRFRLWVMLTLVVAAGGVVMIAAPLLGARMAAEKHGKRAR